MRITYLVTRSDTIGGSHIHVRDLAAEMQKRGHEVSVMMGGDGPVIELFRRKGLQVEVVSELTRDIAPISDVKAYQKIKAFLAGFKPDLVSTHSSKAGFLGRMAAKRLNIPVLFTAHGWSFTDGKSNLKRMLYRTLEKRAAPLADKIITVSDYDRKLALAAFHIPEKNIITIYNGMPDIPGTSRVGHSGSSPVQVVKIARLDRQKNHLELLEAVHDLENIHLHFVGDGPLVQTIRERAEELGIGSRITFWGRLEDVREILSHGDIFALISNWEGFPRSTLEAMRAGLPAVVSDAGGAAEAVVHGKTGYVVPKGDKILLKKYIKALSENPELRREMGQAARRRYETYYTFDIMFQKTYRIYEEITGGSEVMSRES